ncbi:hypothetical protein A3D60_00760 [Candidatus Uhrbacteria bacterium RIFCSPHIGHO2_02_FULL_47_29]|nr:MAG: hypothetical protein A2752_00870 [Candidatus Uhrbacteria bacterium RIFCSPHIGHO2_01_FULL_46_23]OGL69864.1 MAG: hypothetical protein A3D60_00760 [Candidatus Uhrbacteria bacterium RIFCSPHIGHO2_02_FULL_47_29]OGL85239.1 MAG: hypothetical protein A3I37_02830 [Candidatus Uhrbacteria bacterium RIFCSPLOWO2_02_FULL_46_19]
MNIQELFLLIIIVMNVVLAVLVAASNRRDPVNIWFALFAISLALWAGALIAFRTVQNTALTIFFLKLSYLAAIFIASSFYIFIHYFPDRDRFSTTERWFLILSTFFLTIILLLPNVLIVDIIYTPEARVGVQELFGYTIFSFYFILYFFGSLYALYRRWRTANHETKIKLGYILWSILTAGVLGVFFNLILPSPFIQEWRFTWLGPIFTAVIVIAISYAITKHHLLNVKVVAAEMLTASIVFILFIQLIFSQTSQEVIIRFLFFIIIAFFGSFLVRSVRTEVQQKEELAILTKQLEVVNEQLKRLDETKSEFVSIASHQLRTPLTVIKGYISMILEGSFGSVPEKHRQPLEKVYASGERLIQLVENLLSVSRIESGRMKYTMALTQLADVAAKVVDELMPAAKKKQLALKFSMPQKMPPLINLDEEKIRQVMTNLVDNSIKYTKRGTVSVSVHHEPKGAEGHFSKPCVVFSVSDTGNGVRPEDQGRLFQKFIRGQGSALVHTEGTGLGLYVGRMMVEAHGGAIWVESKGEGLGSTFAFAIPLPPPLKDKAQIALEEMLG